MSLYNKEIYNREAILKIASNDITARPDTIIVEETNLRVPGVRQLTERFYRTVQKSPKGLAVWINQGLVPPVFKNNYWDIVLQDDCEMIATEVLTCTGNSIK